MFAVSMIWIAAQSLRAGKIKSSTTFWLLYFFTIMTAVGDFRAWAWSSDYSEITKRVLHDISNTFLAIPGVIVGLNFVMKPSIIAKNLQSSSVITWLRKLGYVREVDLAKETSEIRKVGLFLVAGNGLVLLAVTFLILAVELPAVGHAQSADGWKPSAMTAKPAEAGWQCPPVHFNALPCFSREMNFAGGWIEPAEVVNS